MSKYCLGYVVVTSILYIFLSVSYVLKQQYYELNVWSYVLFTILITPFIAIIFRRFTLSVGSTVFLCLIIGLLLSLHTNSVFYQEDGTFFEFNAQDSEHYHKIAILLKDNNLENFSNILESYKIGDFNLQIDDYGGPIYTYLAYYLYESNLILNFINIILSGAIIYLIYKVLFFFTEKKYAIMGCIFYQVLSFNTFFNSSGLKEPVMLFFCSLGFYCIFKYSKNWNVFYLFLFIIIISPLIYFRSILFFVLIFSLFISLLIKGKNSKFGLSIVCTALFCFLLFFPNMDLVLRFIYYLPNVFLVTQSESANIIKLGNSFVMVASFASALIGPFPTFIPTDGNWNNAMLAPGLLLKMIIFPFFLLSLNYVFNKKHFFLIFSVVFIFIKIIGLSILLDSFEVRRHLTHIPLFLILSFIGFYFFNNRILINKYTCLFIHSYLILIIPFVLLWNYFRI